MIKLILSNLLFLLLIGCKSEFPKAKGNDFYEFREKTRFIPGNTNDVVGKYEYGIGFERSKITFNGDNTFIYEHWTDVVGFNNPVKAIHGKYYLYSDTIICLFESYEYYKDSKAEEIAYFKASQRYKLMLIYLSQKYSPSVFKKVEGRLFIYQHEQMDELRKDFKKFEQIGRVMKLGNGSIVSPQVLMRIDEK